MGMDDYYKCIDCDWKGKKSSRKMHSDYEPGMDVEVWGWSCPECLGEAQKLTDIDLIDIEDHELES